MSAGFRDERYDALLPERVEARLLGLGARMGGLVLLAVTGFIWLSLLTWSVNDPSLTHTPGSDAGNAAGPLGAIVSDLLLQLMGLGAVVGLLAPMAWGLELLAAERVNQFRTKAIYYPLSILVFAGGLSMLPVVSGWPLHHAMGGMLGDLVGEVARSLTGTLIGPDLATLISGIGLIGAGFIAAAHSIGSDPSSWRSTAGARLRWGKSTGQWHQNLKAEAVRLATSGRAAATGMAPTLDGRDSASPAAPAAWHGAAADDDADWDETDDASDPEVPRQPGLWARLMARRGGRDDGPEDLQDYAPDDHAPRGPTVDVEQSIPAQFASSFDHLDTLRPGSRDTDEPEFESGPSSRAIAVRFAPFGANRQSPRDLAAPLPEPEPALAPQRPAVRPSAAARVAALIRPPLSLLRKPAQQRTPPDVSQAALRATSQQLQDVLADYGVKGEMRDVKPGPVVTLYEFEPVRGTKSARVIALADDVARSMSVLSVRAAVVPGRNAIGLELPNAKREPVLLREMLDSESFRQSKAILPMALGKSIGGEPIIADLARMPHLLVAGTTGSGKSVGVNAMILSLLYRHTPDECRFIMIDPKMLELSVYNGIPHLLTPVVTDPHKAVAALGWAVTEMEERYKRMAALSVRNIEAFNQRARAAAERGETLARTVQTGFDRTTGQPRYERQEIDARPMPYIVVVVDEFADLMIVAGKEIEQAVQRLAQMARAAGIHLIMATQRPSVDIITGTIKANFPTRISFKVTSKIDSRTILNEQGAEQLLGQGDMLFSAGAGVITRVHGPFVSDEEVEAVSQSLRSQGEPDYVAGVTETPDGAAAPGMGDAGRGGGEDALYVKAREIVLRDRKASTSYIQRRLSIGYNKAADLIERMERDGLISPANSVGKREILAPGG